MKTVVASPRDVFMDFVTKNRKQLAKSGDFDCFTTSYFTTIGTDLYIRPIVLDENTLVKSQIWHLSENERFSAIRSKYYRGTTAAIFVFSDLEESTITRVNELVKECPIISKKNKISVSLVYNKKPGQDKMHGNDEITSTGNRILEENLSDEIVFSKFYILETPWEKQQEKIREILYDLASHFVKHLT
ncbi:MAG: hypothetical protein ACTSP4_06390 [Candidatus Hodarchaeales archaeon]